MQDKENIEGELVILDTPPAEPKVADIEEVISTQEELRRRAMYALRAEKAKATRKSNTAYKKSLQSACRALLQGDYCTLTDGTKLSGAEIIGIALFERAIKNDRSVEIIAKLSGDLNTKDKGDGNTNSVEEILKNAKIKF